MVSVERQWVMITILLVICPLSLGLMHPRDHKIMVLVLSCCLVTQESLGIILPLIQLLSKHLSSLLERLGVYSQYAPEILSGPVIPSMNVTLVIGVDEEYGFSVVSKLCFQEVEDFSYKVIIQIKCDFKRLLFYFLKIPQSAIQNGVRPSDYLFWVFFLLQ